MFACLLADVLPIRTCMDLYQMAPRVYYALFNDIDCLDFPFVPINEFEAVLYGQNYSITNLHIKQPVLYFGKQYAAFIVNVTTARIFNVKVGNFTIYNCGDFCGFIGFGQPDIYNVQLDVTVRSAHAPSVVGGVLAVVPLCSGQQEWRCSRINVKLACTNCAAKSIGALLGYTDVAVTVSRIMASLRYNGDSNSNYYAAGLIAVARKPLVVEYCGVAVNFNKMAVKLLYGGICALCADVNIGNSYSAIGNDTDLAYSNDFVGSIAAFVGAGYDVVIDRSYARIYGGFAYPSLVRGVKHTITNSYYYSTSSDQFLETAAHGFQAIEVGQIGDPATYGQFDFQNTWRISEQNQGFPDFGVVSDECSAARTCVGLCVEGTYFPETICECPSGYVYSPLAKRCISQNCRYVGDIICDGMPDQCHFVNDTYYCECALNNTCLNGCPYCHGDCTIDLAGKVTCEYCYVGWTGNACDVCASYKCDSTLYPCTTCNGQCVIGYNGTNLCLSCDAGWTGLSCDSCAQGYTLVNGVCAIPRAKSSYLWYIVAVMLAITFLFIVLLYFVWKAVNTKESKLKRVQSCAEHILPNTNRPKVRAPLAKLLNDYVKLEIPLEALQPATKLAPIRTSSRQSGEIVKRVGVQFNI